MGISSHGGLFGQAAGLEQLFPAIGPKQRGCGGIALAL
jgi:hypothetical protein